MNLDMLPEVMAYLLSLVAEIDPGILALATLGAGLAWRVVRRLRVDPRFLLVATRWIRTCPSAAIPFGLFTLALDLALLPLALLIGVRWRRDPEILRDAPEDELRRIKTEMWGGSNVPGPSRIDRLGARLVAIEERLDIAGATAARMTGAMCFDSLRGWIEKLEHEVTRRAIGIRDDLDKIITSLAALGACLDKQEQPLEKACLDYEVTNPVNPPATSPQQEAGAGECAVSVWPASTLAQMLKKAGCPRPPILGTPKASEETAPSALLTPRGDPAAFA